jgi:hypothetical protein
MKNIKLVEFLRKNSSMAMLVGYFLLTLVFSFPLITKLNSQIPEGRGDVFQAMSNIDSRVLALNAAIGFENKVIFLIKNINTFLPYVLLNTILNKYAAYNVMFLASFMLSGVGMYFLALYFTKNKMAAFLAGIVFAFSPFHYYEATVVNIGTMHQEWLPFFALFLFKFFEKFKFKFFVATAFFAFMIAMTEHQFLAFTALFVGVFVVYKLVEDKKLIYDKKLWLYFIGSLGLLAIVAFGMFGQMLKVATSDNNFLDAGMNAANRYSMAVLDPIAPPTFHAIWPNFNASLQGLLFGGESKGSSYFAGFTVLFIVGYLFFSIIKKRRRNEEKNLFKLKGGPISFWIAVTGIFYVFSMGPSFELGKRVIYLPYFLVYKLLPFYENIRTTGRMFVFVLLGLSMLFAYGYIEIAKRYANKKVYLTVLVAVLILLEFWVAPIATMTVSHSAFYDKIAKDGGVYKLIEIPGSTSYAFASYALYLNTIHGKAVLNGMPLARKISKQFAMQQNTPVIKQLLFTIPKGNDPDTKDESDIMTPFDYAKSNEVLTYNNVRYITISKTYANDDVVGLAKKFIEKHVAYVDKYEDDFLIAYDVKQVDPTSFYAQLDDATSDLYSSDFKNANGAKNRELGDGASIKIVNMSKNVQKVKITVGVNGPVGATFAASSDLTGAMILGESEKQYSFSTTLNVGENVIKFSVHDVQGLPIAISEAKKKHQAAIVSNISVLAQ